jgi:two-component system sensor histidine kinase/response regulator
LNNDLNPNQMEKLIAKNSTILIVDDNPENLQVLGNSLQNKNYRVEFATDGTAALEWLKKTAFDLVLLDVMMPGMNGFEVCSKMRTNKKLKDLPVIFLTAETERESILKGFEQGAQDYVTKPFDQRELLARVETQLELKHSRTQLQALNEKLEEKVKERTLQLQKANEELSETHARLSALDKVKTEFLQLISHEIRTPLNGILVPIQLIKEQVDNQDLDQLFEILDTSVSRLESFAYKALLITRLRTNDREISKAGQPLKKIIQTILDELAEKIDQKQIILDIQEAPENLQVKGEYELLKTCLKGILENAVRFSPDNGEIRVNVFQKDSLIYCEINDQGSGFIPDILNRPFELFSADESIKDNNLGLDLYLSKIIMEAHSGLIEVENTEKGGALVRLVF